MKNIVIFILISSIILVILSSCGKTPEIDTARCIQPYLDKIPYPIPQFRIFPEGKAIPDIPKRDPMPAWWKAQWNWLQRLSLPNDRFYWGSQTDMVSLDENVWIAYEVDLIQYNPERNKFELFQFLDGNGYRIDDLLVTQDKNLWVLFWLYNNSKFAIAHYDSISNSFELYFDIFSIDQDVTYPSSRDGYTVIRRPVLHEFNDGQLAFVSNGAVILFDHQENQTEVIFGPEQGFDVASIDISSEGNIWFSVRNDYSVLKYDSKTETIYDYGEPPRVPNHEQKIFFSGKYLMVDSRDWIWAANLGRLEPDKDEGYHWVELPRTSLFIDIYDPYIRYKWMEVESIYDFSDGWIWYTTYNSIVRYSIEHNEWCLSASKASLLTQDENGALWAVGEQQIYKYQMYP